MKLSSLGERRIIELFAEQFLKEGCEDVIVSIGDDCAVLRLGGGDCLLVSTDMVLEKTHIPREMTPVQLGGYAVNVVLSDIAAMGGSPLGTVFSIGLPSRLDDVFVKELAGGMEDAAKEHGTCIVGGDTKEAGEITITGTAFGSAIEKNLLLRSYARLGDLICVTGAIGSAAAGFYCLTKNIPGYEHFIKHAMEPKARLKEGSLLSGLANACMDVSDGLAWSIHEITKQSGVGSKIYEEKIPFDPGVNEVSGLSKVKTEEIVLYMGGDFELLFTISPDRIESVEADFGKIGSKVSIIGEITKKGNIIIDKDGKERLLEKRGWEAFKNPDV